MKYKFRFLAYGSDDADIRLQAPLTSSSADGDGILSWGSTQGGGQDFNSDGMDVQTATGIRWNATGGDFTDRERMFDACSIKMDVDTGWLNVDNTPNSAAQEYLFAHTSGGTFYKTIGGGVKTAWESTSTGDVISISDTGKSSQSTVLINEFRGHADLYIDDLLVSTNKRLAPMDRSTYSNFYACCSANNATNGPRGYRTKNFEVSLRPQVFPISKEYGSIGFIGDSFTVLGSFPAWCESAKNSNRWNPGFGFDAADAPEAGGSYNDAGLVPSFFRTLSKNGVWTKNNRNHARSGGALVSNTQVTTKLTELLTLNNYVPKVLISGVGTNDARDLGITQADFDTNIKALITTANTAGVSTIVFWTIPSLRADPTYRTAAYDENTDVLNGYINNLPAWATTQGYSIGVKVCPAFENFGGHSINRADFGTNDIHPSEQGSNKLGKWVAETLL